jgi:hypothetical protein
VPKVHQEYSGSQQDIVQIGAAGTCCCPRPKQKLHAAIAKRVRNIRSFVFIAVLRDSTSGSKA